MGLSSDLTIITTVAIERKSFKLGVIAELLATLFQHAKSALQ
ncbi:MAG: hypothetical protein ACJA0N_002255 [Pseudohongiellaceae bacterium]|jgi:hypothetical protein